LLAGKIANLHWILDKKCAAGFSDRDLGPLRNKVNALLAVYQQGREYYDCSAPDFIDDDDVDPFAGFDFCCKY